MQYSKQVREPEKLFGAFSDGITVLVSGFGLVGQPLTLLELLVDSGLKSLTIVSNNAGNGDVGLGRLIRLGRVAKVICSFPRQPDSDAFNEKYRAGEIELELVPQGTLAERLRAAGAGISGFFTETGVGTALEEGKERRHLFGREVLLEFPLRGDLALVRAHVADDVGNLQFRKTARNFGPVMCQAASTTVVEVDKVVRRGALNPDSVVTPSIFVDFLWNRGEHHS